VVWIRLFPDGVKDDKRDTVALKQVRAKRYWDSVDHDGSRFQFPLQNRAGRRKAILRPMQTRGLGSGPAGSPAESE